MATKTGFSSGSGIGGGTGFNLTMQ